VARAITHELRSYISARRGRPVTEDFNVIQAQAQAQASAQALNK
jgi:hypothetical protein